MAEPRKRSAVLAGVLTAVAGGVGFLYLGRWRWAAAVTIVFPLILAISAWTRLIHRPLGLAITALALISVLVAAIVLAVRMARRQEPLALNRYQRWYVYLGFYIAVSIAFSVLLDHRGRLFGYDVFRVPSSSMRDTLMPGDYFVSNSWEFKDRTPGRGEVVVFLFPKDTSLKYVQRVVGLPGDTVQIQGSSVRVNGVALNESYVRPENRKGLSIRNGEFKVPAGEFFVLGDNRDNSNDSRFWGTVPAANLYGSAEYLWWSYGVEGLRMDRIGKWIKQRHE